MRVGLAEHFRKEAESKGGRLFVMYGQTEATARMAYVPPEDLANKAGSIGIAIPGGKLWLEPVDSEPSVRQLYYRGPNVMLGYAAGPADLARGDEMGGILATGDLGDCDADGYFRISGRLARFAKLFGKRVNLSSVEAEIEGKFPLRAAALDGGELLKVFIEQGSASDAGAVRAYLAELIGVPPVAIKVATLDRLPLTAAGKKDYKALS